MGEHALMPYINLESRKVLAKGWEPDNPGELNYMITILIDRYLMRDEMNYQAINDIIGALEGAKLEFYRRIAVPYEREKRKENGEVYESKIV
jgi:aspartyl/asparaginyl beta-hydroxylase (cupin superfamily)